EADRTRRGRTHEGRARIRTGRPHGRGNVVSRREVIHRWRRVLITHANVVARFRTKFKKIDPLWRISADQHGGPAGLGRWADGGAAPAGPSRLTPPAAERDSAPPRRAPRPRRPR